jgi:photosystem II stability/assembly factor-like uncharacterized protein
MNRINNLKWPVFLMAIVLQTSRAQSWQPMLPMDPTLNLNDLCFLSDGLHGWAVGTTGAGGQVYSAVYRTTDGAAWTTVPFGDSTYAALNGVCFVNANQGWAVGSGGRIYATTNGGNSWTLQTSPTSRNLSKVHFINAQYGWACGGWGDNSAYLVIRTTNGGANWQDLSFGSTAYSCDDVYFCDPLNGWICGYDNTINSQIHHTTDGGLNWTRQTVPPNVGQVAAIDFPTSTKGWATTSSIYATTSGAILHTTDAGANWTVQGYTNLHYNNCLDCQDTMRIAISSSQVLSPADARVVVSTNGGNSWSSYTHLFRTYTMGVQYVGNSIWTVSNSSQIIKSTNSGANWQWSYNTSGWQAMSWRDSANGYLVTGTDAGIDGYSYRTTNAGNTWFHDPNTPGGGQIQFVNSSRGWILKEGNAAGVYRTTNAGTSWTYNSIGTGNWIGAMFFATQDSGWACGSNGTLRFTSNGGASWSSQSPGNSNYVSAVYFTNSRQGWLCGGYGGANGFISHTTDGGANWIPQTPAQPDHFQAACFVNNNLGILGAFSGIVHRTTDGGTNWSVVQSLPHYTITDIVMKDTLTGWLIAYNYWGSSPGDDGRGFIYQTTDGGASWNQSYTTPRIRSFLNDIAYHYDDVFWACGSHNIDLKYTPPTGVVESQAGVRKTVRFQVTPNPFARQTTIHLALENPARVQITVYNALGRRVAQIDNGIKPAGNHVVTWNGRDERNHPCVAGLYLCVIKAGAYTETHKLLLIK